MISSTQKPLCLTKHFTLNRQTSDQRRDPNPQSQQASGRRPTSLTARPLGLASCKILKQIINYFWLLHKVHLFVSVFLSLSFTLGIFLNRLNSYRSHCQDVWSTESSFLLPLRFTQHCIYKTEPSRRLRLCTNSIHSVTFYKGTTFFLDLSVFLFSVLAAHNGDGLRWQPIQSCGAAVRLADTCRRKRSLIIRGQVLKQVCKSCVLLSLSEYLICMKLCVTVHRNCLFP